MHRAPQVISASVLLHKIYNIGSKSELCDAVLRRVRTAMPLMFGGCGSDEA